MTTAGALFIGMAVGLAASVASIAVAYWRLSRGRQRGYPFALLILAITVAPSTVVAVAMPTFKTAMVAFVGGGIGGGVSHVVTLPLGAVLARRVERRRKSA